MNKKRGNNNISKPERGTAGKVNKTNNDGAISRLNITNWNRIVKYDRLLLKISTRIEREKRLDGGKWHSRPSYLTVHATA